MKKRTTICLICFFTFFTFSALAQEDDLSWTIRMIKENYPGFKDKTNERTFDQFVSKVHSANKSRDEFRILSSIVNYFSDQHLRLYNVNAIENVDSVKCSQNLVMINNYFKHQKSKAKYEGIWVNDYNNCIMAIKKVSASPLIYYGYILESRNNVLLPGLIACEFEQEIGTKFNTKYIINNRSGQVYIKSIFRNDSIMTTGYFAKWKKISSYQAPLLEKLPLYNFKASSKIINDSTFLITIPRFNRENTMIVDSLVSTNKNNIEKSKLLIVDVRNNLGGSIGVYIPLLPFIYTSPIKTVDGDLYCCPGFIKDHEDDLAFYKSRNTLDTMRIDKLGNQIMEMKKNAGGFLFYNGTTFKYDSIKRLPQKVALIVNYGCVSAGELMCLNFRQSNKVTIFGENTQGVVDYLDDYNVRSPSKKYMLIIPGTVRKLTKSEPKYDGIGITPDVQIPDKEIDWVGFVIKYYEK